MGSKPGIRAQKRPIRAWDAIASSARNAYIVQLSMEWIVTLAHRAPLAHERRLNIAEA